VRTRQRCARRRINYNRVVAYVVRGASLLVFDHRDFPAAGTQVPAGTVEDDEAPADAVVREVHEETGLDARVVRELGTLDAIAPKGEPRRNHYFELATDDTRDEWEHVVHGGGGDDGLVFVCRFVPLSPSRELMADADYLEAL
jgi:8-oxo-dGTP pyrophosphatase MutT (NUDIX family)